LRTIKTLDKRKADPAVTYWMMVSRPKNDFTPYRQSDFSLETHS